MQKEQEEIIILDLGSHFVRTFDTVAKYYKLKENKVRILRDVLKHLQISSISEVTDTSQFLEDYMNFVELKMRNIVTKYTCHELLFWTRRIAPMNVFQRSHLTVLLYREVLNNAITKYGSLENKFYVDKSKNVMQPAYMKTLNFASELSNEICKVIADSYYLEDLASLYIYITQRYRITNKGGRLIENNDWGFDVEAPSTEIGFLIDLYDRRTKYNNLLAATGTYVPTKLNVRTQNMLLTYRHNVDFMHKVSIPFGNKDNSFNSNYIPVPVNFDSYLDYIMLFEKEILNVYNFSPKTFISFISALSTLNISNFGEDVRYQYNMLQRAYTFCFDLDNLFNELNLLATEFYQSKFGTIPEDFTEQSALVFKLLTSEKEHPRNIELWTGGPRKVIYPIKNGEGIIDYSGLNFTLSTFMFPISRLDGNTANKRSTDFELKTIDFVKRNIKKAKFWVGQKQIFNSLKTKSKEIDASFYIGNVLFILECKSINVSFGFDMGTKKALDYRKRKNLDALNQVREKVHFLIENKNDLTLPLPREVEYLVPIVVSPFAEYMWEKSDLLFISDDLPRVLTIEELSQISEVSDFDKLLNNDFCYKLNDRKI
ncbi:hypothetical protein SAMN04487777_10737 [Priestia aryabhattai B8W22]|uniref:hypothetical protein n=1 Tax=Priestia aryabhattai TaxID=412384 RepID=UPI0008838541|nr:hypothetical protein SAMN04487777_10737 [Priestia aryabhattai B8W22]